MRDDSHTCLGWIKNCSQTDHKKHWNPDLELTLRPWTRYYKIKRYYRLQFQYKKFYQSFFIAAFKLLCDIKVKKKQYVSFNVAKVF